MKVRISHGQILLYAPEAMRTETELLGETLRRDGFSVVRCGEADISRSIADCCAGRHGSHTGDAEPVPVPEPMAVLAGLDTRQMNRALALLRPLPMLKAVRTDANRDWTWAQLYEALCSERARFRAAEAGYAKEESVDGAAEK